jgi:hypothetical protein
MPVIPGVSPFPAYYNTALADPTMGRKHHQRLQQMTLTSPMVSPAAMPYAVCSRARL